MRYTYYIRGRCLDCGDLIWLTHIDQNIICKCGKASIMHRKAYNTEPITDAELVEALLDPVTGDFWWLPGQTDDITIDIIKGVSEW